MRCPDCGTEMRPLAISMYCPNDCDRKVQEEIDPEKTPRLINWKDANLVGPCLGLTASGFTGSCDQTDTDWSWIDNLDWPSD